MIVFLAIYVAVLGYLIKEVSDIKAKNEKNKESLNQAFKQISGILTSSSKILKLIQKVQASLSNDIAKVVHDIDDLYKYSATQAKSIKFIMDKHNETVNTLLGDIRDLHCDINDYDCSLCTYRDQCISLSSKEDLSDSPETEDSEEDGDDDYNGESLNFSDSPIGCKEGNRFTIDPSSKGAFNQLRTVMCKSGVPKDIVNNYIAYIKKMYLEHPQSVVNKMIEVVWLFGDNPEAGVIKHKFTKKEANRDKLVDPNSKIVKTLNKLYKNP